MLKIVIADDEEPIRNLLINYLKSFEEVKVVGTAGDGENLLAVVRETSPDAIFVDIQMPGLDGLTAVHQLQHEFPSLFIVFVSGHTNYAVDAFNLDATDFLAKPITIDRLKKSLDKLQRSKYFNAKNSNNGDTIKTDNKERLMLKCGHGIIMVEKEGIFFVEKQGRKCVVHTIRGLYETASSLADIENSLRMPDFFRCHKGFIINVKLVERIVPYADRAYEISFYNYPHRAPMRRDMFEEFQGFFGHNTL